MSVLLRRNNAFLRCSKISLGGDLAIVLGCSRCFATRFTSEDDYQYMQRSKLPTLHFQNSLPPLPRPKLEETCQRYLNSQRALLDGEALRHTESCVSKFLAEEGQVLQRELRRIAPKNSYGRYLGEIWFDMYLKDRRPLPINYNPMLVFAPESDSSYDQQLVKATNLVISSLRFMRSLRDGILEPEVYHLVSKNADSKLFRNFVRLLPSSVSCYGAYLFKAFPLDMSQYPNLFNSTRVPRLEKDEIVQDVSARHLVVLRKGHFYDFDVLDERGCIRSPLEIASNLKAILDDRRPENRCPVGVMTTSERDRWATTRQHLLELGNERILKSIDSAAFLLILDDEAMAADNSKILRSFMHADGTNRWFDKSFSLIVARDGTAGVNFEHSWGDGVAVLRYFQDVKKDIAESPCFHPADVAAVDAVSTAPRKLDFLADARIRDTVEAARREYKEWTEGLNVDMMIYDGLGKKDCKSWKISSDAVMQLAFQLAHYKQNGRAVPTYESCSTAAFKFGRTETIRPCTAQTKAFCEALIRRPSDISVSQLKTMIADCSSAHAKLTMEAATGKGFDRHLFVLKNIWEAMDTAKPALFEDPAYEKLNYNILSTSTLSSPAVVAGGFGPVVADGYGIGYMIQDRRLGAVVTSYKEHRNGSDYINCLESAFKDIHKILLSN